MKTFDIAEVPFSMYGSYIAISHLPENYRNEGIKEGVYLRTVRGGAQSSEVARIFMTKNGQDVDFTFEARPAELVFHAGEDEVCFCFADKDTLLVKAEGKDVGFRLEMIPAAPFFDYISEVPVDGRMQYLLTCFGQYTKFMMWAQEGEASLEETWQGCVADDVRMSFSGETVLAVIQEAVTEWNGVTRDYNYEECLQKTEAEFLAFHEKMPSVPERFADTAKLASYADWSAVAGKGGFLKRNSMMMSKNWMNSLWSWDHLFNAITLAYGNPQEAWDQWVLPFDYQDATGCLPDRVQDSRVDWNYCKPPLHGWALTRMMRVMTLTDAQMAEAYEKLSRLTEWWLNYRDHDHDGICEYTHGYDSGWDNNTVFSRRPPVESPDLQTFLILQMETLADLAEKLGRKERAEDWKKRSEKMLAAMLTHCFRDGKPVTVHSGSHEVTESRSLLNYMPILLGKRLPEDIRTSMLEVLKSDEFHTPYGLATESPKSEFYETDGYWRGPVWPSAMNLYIDGIYSAGDEEFAVQLAEEYCAMVEKNRFAENYDALSGQGLRDRAYTWAPSVFLTLAHDYLK